ncbi:glycosyltransferase, partial [Methylopila musalis]
MRVLIAAVGTIGDVLPFVALGLALERRGHEATLLAPAPFEALIRRAGLAFEPLLSEADYTASFGDPATWRPLLGARRLFAALPLTLDPVFRAAERLSTDGARPVIVASTLAIGGRLAFEALGGHLVTAHLSPSALQSRHDAPRLPGLPLPKRLPPGLKWWLQLGADEHMIDPVALPRLNAVRERLGLGRVNRLRHWWNSPQAVAALFPDWFQAPQPDWPARTVQLSFPRVGHFGSDADAPDAALEAFLDGGEPPVVVTFGSTRRRTEALYQAAMIACAKAGRRCLALSRTALDIPEPAAGSTFVAPYAPLERVLPKARAVIHHGGVGTTAQAFAVGLPQIVAPLAFDQFDHAARVAALGCGLWFRPGPLERARL